LEVACASTSNAEVGFSEVTLSRFAISERKARDEENKRKTGTTGFSEL
jgi:hypothetical protein